MYHKVLKMLQILFAKTQIIFCAVSLSENNEGIYFSYSVLWWLPHWKLKWSRLMRTTFARSHCVSAVPHNISTVLHIFIRVITTYKQNMWNTTYVTKLELIFDNALDIQKTRIITEICQDKKFNSKLLAREEATTVWEGEDKRCRREVLYDITMTT